MNWKKNYKNNLTEKNNLIKKPNYSNSALN